MPFTTPEEIAGIHFVKVVPSAMVIKVPPGGELQQRTNVEMVCRCTSPCPPRAPGSISAFLAPLRSPPLGHLAVEHDPKRCGAKHRCHL